jgi:hypothetical protein
VAAPYRGAYCASKFAVEALADSLRMELAPTGIRIVLIEPGPIASRFLEHALEAYRRNINLEASAHSEIYCTRIARLEEGGDQTFKLGPEAVALKLVDALESRNPKPRYYVTIPTYAAALFRRLLRQGRSTRLPRGTRVPARAAEGYPYGNAHEIRHSHRPCGRRRRAFGRALEHAARRQPQHQPTLDALARGAAIHRALPRHGRHLSGRQVIFPV